MTLECTRVGGINLAQGVCDTELPLPVGQGAKEAIDAGINSGSFSLQVGNPTLL